MKIFISGSISIKKLPKIAIQKIDNIIKNNYEILLGDAKGIDSCVQKYLQKSQYRNVKIYCAGNSVRNNIGNWPINKIESAGETGRKLYTLKDKAMANDADYGMMIWDGKSEGTLNNISEMQIQNKKFYVVMEELIVSQDNIGKIIEINDKSKNEELIQTDLF